MHKENSNIIYSQIDLRLLGNHQVVFKIGNVGLTRREIQCISGLILGIV